MFNILKTALTLSSLFSLASAVIVPTSPDGNTVVKVGSDINALWTEDSTGQWTDVEVQLMTGDNLNMVALATVATGIDGTTTSSLNIPCPDVSPYSKIYFLQFTKGGDVSTATWTTRFTISGADGSVTDPTNSTVYNGNTVQWGTGAIVGQAPSVITGTGNSTSSSSNSTAAVSASASASASSAAGIVSTISVAPSSTSDAAASSASSASAMSAMSSMSVSASRAAASASTSSGAAMRGSTIGMGAVILGLAGLVAL